MFSRGLSTSRGPFFSAKGFEHRRTILRNFAVTSIVGSKSSMKVTVLGAAGRTGTCLSFFLKQSPLIDELSIYDKAEQIPSVALELSHVDTKCKVTCFESNEEGLRDTLEDAKIVVITAGEPCDGKRFSKNALRANGNILLDYVPNVIKYSPRALIALATSPINHLVPLVAEIYKKHGVYDYNRIFGITTLNCMRANTFAAALIDLEPECVMVPVIGGNCAKTCVPVFSQIKPSCRFSHEELSKLAHSVTAAEDEVAGQYNGKGNSSLSMGFAAARFCTSLCKGLRAERGVVECAYTRSCVVPEVTYFAGPVELGPCGIQKYLGVPPLTDRECKNLASAIPHLKEAIKSGEALALGPRETSTEMCPQHPGICGQEISGKMRKSDKLPQLCPN